MEEMIENYLLVLLSEAETKAFENRIATDENLAREVAVQRDIMQAAKLQGLKADISNAYRNVRMGKMLKTVFIAFLIVAIVGFGVYYITKNKGQKIESSEIGTRRSDYKFDMNCYKVSDENSLSDSLTPMCNDVTLEPENSFNQTESLTNLSLLKTDNSKIAKRDNEIVTYTNRIAESEKKLNTRVVLINNVSKDSLFTTQPTTFPTQTNLFAHLRTEYPSFYAKLNEDFDLTDPTFHASFQVNYCNFSKTPIITAASSNKTKQYEIDMSDKFIKSREFRKFFELCAMDCGGS